MTQLPHRIVEMTDDSGYLGLVDPHAYTSFVGANWTLEGRFERVESEMEKRRVLLWGTGGEEQWQIEVSNIPIDPRLPIIRQITGPITVTQGELIVVNLDTLTMAAEYEDSAVDDDKTIYNSSIHLPNGDYLCTITQLTDPEADRPHNAPDFHLHLHLHPGQTPPWPEIPWSDL